MRPKASKDIVNMLPLMIAGKLTKELNVAEIMRSDKNTALPERCYDIFPFVNLKG